MCIASKVHGWMLVHCFVSVLLGPHLVLVSFRISTSLLLAQPHRVVVVVPVPQDCVLIAVSHSPISRRGLLRIHAIVSVLSRDLSQCYCHLCRLDSREKDVSLRL